MQTDTHTDVTEHAALPTLYSASRGSS